MAMAEQPLVNRLTADNVNYVLRELNYLRNYAECPACHSMLGDPRRSAVCAHTVCGECAARRPILCPVQGCNIPMRPNDLSKPDHAIAAIVEQIAALENAACVENPVLNLKHIPLSAVVVDEGDWEGDGEGGVEDDGEDDEDWFLEPTAGNIPAPVVDTQADVLTLPPPSAQVSSPGVQPVPVATTVVDDIAREIAPAASDECDFLLERPDAARPEADKCFVGEVSHPAGLETSQANDITQQQPPVSIASDVDVTQPPPASDVVTQLLPVPMASDVVTQPPLVPTVPVVLTESTPRLSGPDVEAEFARDCRSRATRSRPDTRFVEIGETREERRVERVVDFASSSSPSSPTALREKAGERQVIDRNRAAQITKIVECIHASEDGKMDCVVDCRPPSSPSSSTVLLQHVKEKRSLDATRAAQGGKTVVCMSFLPSVTRRKCLEICHSLALTCADNFIGNVRPAVVVTPLDEDRKVIQLSFNALNAMLLGLPIVDAQWLFECENEGTLLSMDDFLSTSRCSKTDGTLFSGLVACLDALDNSESAEQLASLIRVGGGRVVTKSEFDILRPEDARLRVRVQEGTPDTQSSLDGLHSPPGSAPKACFMANFLFFASSIEHSCCPPPSEVIFETLPDQDMSPEP
jgi:hypothetical protein